MDVRQDSLLSELEMMSILGGDDSASSDNGVCTNNKECTNNNNCKNNEICNDNGICEGSYAGEEKPTNGLECTTHGCTCVANSLTGCTTHGCGCTTT